MTSSGDVAGFDDSIVDENICIEGYRGLLIPNAPMTVTTTLLPPGADEQRELVVEAAAVANPNAKLIAVFDMQTGMFNGETFYGCVYYYVAQDRSGTSTSPRTIRVLLSGSDGSNARIFKTSTFELNHD